MELVEHKKYWDKKKKILKELYYTKNGKLEGELKYWYDNGQLGEQSFWKNGKRYDSKEAYEEACINERMASWTW